MKLSKTEKSVLLIVVMVMLSLAAFSQEKSVLPDGNALPRGDYYRPATPLKTSKKPVVDLKDMELPCSQQSEEVVRHRGYTLSYNSHHKQANWVAYTLTEAKRTGGKERGNQFRPDPKVSHGSASNDDYRKSGYDRGHLAPAADQGYSDETMRESFYLSNMSPQEPGFNRGIWKTLETRVRDWSVLDSVLFIASAGILVDGLNVIGQNKVSVPESFYKVILAYRKGNPTAIGFLMPNEKSTEDVSRYMVTVDSVEQVTGIDFFCKLPDKMERQAESAIDTAFWFHSR